MDSDRISGFDSHVSEESTVWIMQQSKIKFSFQTKPSVFSQSISVRVFKEVFPKFLAQK